MSFFSRFRRNSTAADRYPNRPAYYAYPSSARPRHARPRHARHDRQRFGTGGTYSHAVSEESIPYLPSETTRGTASEVSLRSEYTHLDHDTSRYPKWSTSTSSAPSSTYKRPTEKHRQTSNTYGRKVDSQVASIIAVSTLSFTWDVRDPPARIQQHRNPRRADDVTTPVLSTQAQSLCIVSHDFPWTIAISTNDGQPLTIIDVLNALYESLMKEVRRSEWALASETQKYITLQANKDRRHANMAMRIRRVDWLGSSCMFCGLVKDSELIRKRMMPGDHLGEMWAVRFGAMH